MPIISGSGGSSSGGLPLLYSNTLLATAASIDTGAAGISAAYSHLLILGQLRSANAASTDGCAFTFNNDGGANYYTQTAQAFAATASARESLGGTSIDLELITGGTSTAAIFTPLEIFVPRYAQTVAKKSLQGMCGYRRGDATGNMVAKSIMGFYDSATAITRLAFTPTTGPLAIGSSISIYGIA